MDRGRTSSSTSTKSAPRAEGRPGPPSGGGFRLPVGLAVVLLAAAAFRVFYLVTWMKDPILRDTLILDASIYDAWAQRIAGGAWIGRESFYFAPLYPYLLALLERVAGHALTIVYVLQAILGLASIVLLHSIAERLSGARAALWTAGMAALYLPFAFFETKILGVALGSLLCLVALHLLLRAEENDGRRSDGLAGAGVGLLSLCLPAAQLLALLCTLDRLARRRFGAALSFALGAFAVLLPSLLHNLAAAGDLQLVSAQGGVTFYQGNNPQAVGLFMPPPGFTGAADLQADEERAVAEREVGHPLKRSEISSHFLRKGFAFIVGSPLSWLALEGRKAMALVGSYEPSTEYSQYVERERLPILWGAFLPFAAIGALALAHYVSGIAAADARGRALHLYMAWAAAVPLLFYMSSRYRLPLVPALLIPAGAFVARAVSTFRRGEGPDPSLARGVLAAAVFFLISFLPLGRPAMSVEANVHYNLGSALADRGQHEDAVAEYDRCLALWPTHTYALVNRGNSLARLGRDDEALDTFSRASDSRPTFWTARKAEGAALVRAGRLDEAAAVYRKAAEEGTGGGEAWFALGSVLLDQKRPGEAREPLEKSIAQQPSDPRFHNSLGLTLQQLGDAAGAEREFRQASALSPRYEKSRYNLGNLLFTRGGSNDEAQKALEEAVRIAPDYVKAHVRLAEVLMQKKDLDGARREIETALRIDPNDNAAQGVRKRLGEAR
ncbi:MAG TPA: tetratricopeptide repeat protein [Verrucomicrobiae bacterium]|nr:tetratricopeptide repeat protein [Verrucomicrobiae bacterium]